MIKKFIDSAKQTDHFVIKQLQQKSIQLILNLLLRGKNVLDRAANQRVEKEAAVETIN